MSENSGKFSLQSFSEVLDDFPVRVFNEFFYELVGQGAVHIYPVPVFLVEVVGRSDSGYFSRNSMAQSGRILQQSIRTA